MQQGKFTLTESERNRIQSLYKIGETLDFVFDFVITENEKYVIIMDQVFVAGGGGDTIGSIWENTYVLNDIINETVSKLDTLNEEVKKNITEAVENIVWKKELVAEWIKEKGVISEGLWDDIKSGAGNVLSKVGSTTIEVAKTVFNKGILPALRWVRRGLYTGVGIVIDVIVSILAAKSNAIVWFVIVLLDIYEIATGDFDPQDPERMQMPFFFLFADLLGCIFTGAVALTTKKAIPAIAKQGIEKAAPQLAKTAKSLGSKLPSVKSQLKSTALTLEKKLGPKSSGVLGKIRGFIDAILDELINFIPRLFSKQGVKATVAGGVALGVGKGAEMAMGLDKGNTVGKWIVKTDQKIKDKTGMGNIKIDDNETETILSFAQLK